MLHYEALTHQTSAMQAHRAFAQDYRTTSEILLQLFYCFSVLKMGRTRTIFSEDMTRYCRFHGPSTTKAGCLSDLGEQTQASRTLPSDFDL